MSGYVLDFDGKVAVITGGGGGIGKATAGRFLDEGASVVLTGRRHEVLDLARRQLDPSGDRIELFAGDVELARRLGGARRQRARALRRRGRPRRPRRSLQRDPFLEQTEEQVEEALDSILRPTFYGSQAAARAMVAAGSGGAIVNVGSCGRSTRSRRRRRAPTPRPRRGAIH